MGVVAGGVAELGAAVMDRSRAQPKGPPQPACIPDADRRKAARHAPALRRRGQRRRPQRTVERRRIYVLPPDPDDDREPGAAGGPARPDGLTPAARGWTSAAIPPRRPCLRRATAGPRAARY